ncbi:MAG TPA: DUF1707 domain-containing protein [Thermoleophilaceae bacterium]
MSELDLRASDGDRERAVDELRAHAADGRLTVEELEERVQRALAARTLGELADLTRDLPNRESAPPRTAARRRRSRRPDVRAFLAVNGPADRYLGARRRRLFLAGVAAGRLGVLRALAA